MVDTVDGADPKDPMLEQFAELRQCVEFSHKELRGNVTRLERKVDAGFDRLARKIDSLGRGSRPSTRRRKP